MTRFRLQVIDTTDPVTGARACSPSGPLWMEIGKNAKTCRGCAEVRRRFKRDPQGAYYFYSQDDLDHVLLCFPEIQMR